MVSGSLQCLRIIALELLVIHNIPALFHLGDSTVNSDKRLIAEKVIGKVKQLDPPGRFLGLENGVWMEQSHEKIVLKTHHVLRERKWQQVDCTSKGSLPSADQQCDPDYISKKPVNLVASISNRVPAKKRQSSHHVRAEKRNLSCVKKSKIAGVQIGSRISVYWPLDKVYYAGFVGQCKGKFAYINYDDGENEWLDLTKNEFNLHDECSSNSS